MRGMRAIAARVRPARPRNPHESREGRGEALARAILKGSPFSHARIKSLVYEGLGAEVDAHMARHTAALAECFASADHQEGVASFLERREARFTGR